MEENGDEAKQTHSTTSTEFKRFPETVERAGAIRNVGEGERVNSVDVVE